MKERGSITVFLTVLLPFLLIIALFISEYAQIRFLFRKAEADEYLHMDQALSAFHRPLFQELGILAVDTVLTEPYLHPLSEDAVLEQSISQIMQQKMLVDGVGLSEKLVNEFIQNRTGIKLELFDVRELNDELIQLIAFGNVREDIEDVLKSFIPKLLAMQPYVEVRGIGFAELIDMLRNCRFDELREISPVFVIRPSLRAQYDRLREAMQKYDVLNVLGRYELADYAISYVGYSLTAEDTQKLYTEYLVTGIQTKAIQRPVIAAELYSLRLLMNVTEIFVNPALRAKVLKSSGGNPKLFLLEALSLAATESGFDVNDLISRNKVPLYKGKQGFQVFSGGMIDYKSGWQYPDYLAILTMLQSKDTYLKRLRTVMGHNYEIDPAQCYTMIHLEKEFRIEASILPYTFHRKFIGELSYLEQGLPER